MRYNGENKRKGAGALETSTAAGLSLDRLTCIRITDECLRPAAVRLSAALQPLLGRALAVVADGDEPGFLLTVDSSRSGGYTIAAEGENPVIAGANAAQTMRGVYGFLRDVCGARMFTAGAVTYPAKLPKIPADLSLSYTPPFEVTETDWFSPKHTDYALWNGLTGTVYRPLPAEAGGVAYVTPMAHTMTKTFCAADTYFAAHPEYFALRHGKRTKTQLCLSNPDVLRVVTDEVLALLREKHDPASPLQILSLSQADNLGFCRCPACRKTDRKHGSHAGTVLAFVNAVARAVKEAGYDNVVVETLAYQYSRTPPRGIRPEKNVAVRLCTIECCFSHPLADPACKPNAAFAVDLRGWAAICDRLYVWDYGANYGHFAGLFPNFHVLAPNMRFFAENGVKGVYAEGNYTLKAPDTAFGELRAYLLTCLFRDPFCDLAAERAAFLQAVYGNGGQAVGEFLDFVCDNAKTRHLGIFQPMRRTLRLTARDVTRCDAWWDEAEAQAGDNAETVRRSRLCFRYWKMKNRRGEFRNPFSARRRREALFQDLAAAGMTRLSEMSRKKATVSGILQTAYFAVYPLACRVMRWLYRV